MVSTSPNFLAEIMLDQNKIDFMFNGVFLNSQRFQVGSTFMYDYNKLQDKMEVDCFLSTLLHCYQNNGKSLIK
jgi:hypothetical protein